MIPARVLVVDDEPDVEPLSPDQSADPAVAQYRDAFALLQAKDPAAKQAFAALMGQNAGDPLASYRLGRLLNGEEGCEIRLSV